MRTGLLARHLSGVVERLVMTGVPARVLLFVIVLSSAAVTISVALGNPSGLIGGIAGPVGAGIAALCRDRRFRRLTTADRGAVRRAQATGVSTGDHYLDRLAVERLKQSCRSLRADRVVLPILLFCMIAATVASAHQNMLWIAVAVPSLTAFGYYTAWRLLDDPRPRFVELTETARVDV